MTRSRLTLLAFVTLLAGAMTATGCSKMEPRSGAPAPPPPPAVQNALGGEPALGGMVPADRAMRITVETSVVVADIDAAIRSVRELTARHGGYVGEARVSGDDASRWASFEVHVPVPRLGAFRAAMAGLGDVASDAEKAEDVTEQRADIKARLGNARAAEKRLLDLLDKRTGSLADVVAVEKELTGARETIERMEAQERLLEGQIASATVKINLSTRHAAARVGPGKRIVQAAGDGIDAAGTFLLGLAVVAVSSAPTLSLLVLMGYAVYRVVRFIHRKKLARTG